MFLQTQTQSQKKTKKGLISAPQQEYKNIIRKNDCISKNEIEISKIIQTIPFFSLSFETVYNSKKVNMSEIDDEQFEQFEKNEIIKKEGYVLIQYKRENRVVKLLECFSPCLNIKQDILCMIHSFQALIKNIQLLNQTHIVNLNIHPHSIIYRRRDRRYIMTDFMKAIDISGPKSKENISLNPQPLLSHYTPNDIYYPVEYHILCYINERNQSSISRFNMEEIYDEVALSLSGIYNINEFKDTTVFSLQSIINKSKIWINNAILSETIASTWNHYSLSILYLQLISFMEHRYGPHVFFHRFHQLLLQNIHPIYSKRETANKTEVLFADIIDSISEKEWNQLLKNS